MSNIDHRLYRWSRQERRDGSFWRYEMSRALGSGNRVTVQGSKVDRHAALREAEKVALMIDEALAKEVTE